MQNSELTIDDFSGGFTDNYLGGRPNKFERGDNFKLTSNNKLRSRDGSVIIDPTYYQLPDGAVRLGTLIPFDRNDTLFWHYARKLYYVNGGFTNLVGPTGNQAFDLFTTSDYLSWGQWQKQIFAVPSSGSLSNTALPVRIYKDASNVWQLRTAGLPSMVDTTLNYVSATALASMITLANDLRTKMLDHYGAGVADTISRLNAVKTKINGHIASTIFHNVAQSPLVTAANATDIATAVTLCKDIQARWRIHVADSNKAAAWTYHTNQSNLSAFGLPDSLPITGIGSVKDYLNFLYTWFNTHDATGAIHGGASSGFQLAAQTGRYIQHDADDAAADAVLTSAAATNLPTLITLLNQMSSAYRIHIADATNAFPTVHRLPWPSPGNYWTFTSNYDEENTDTPLTYTDAATDLETAAVQLAELRLRWNIHAGKSYYHAGLADSDNISAVLPVEGVTHGPYVQVDHTAFYRAAIELRDKFVSHMEKAATGSAEHKDVSNNSSGVTHTPLLLTTPVTTPTELADMLFSLRGTYFTHMALNAYAGYHYAASLIAADEPLDIVTYSVLAGYTAFSDLYGSAPPYHFDRQLVYINDLRAKFLQHIKETAPHNSVNTLYDSPRGADLELASYIYALHYEYTYNVGTVEYVDRGPLLLIQADQIPTIEIQSAKILAIPTLTNTGQQNYDTANLKIKIARTPKNGIAFYYCGEIANGVTSFTDSMKDADLLNQEPLYTEGGVVENDPPPMSKAFHICDNTGYYGNVTVGTENLPNRVMQSHANDIDSVPATFYVDLEHPVTLISSAKSRVIAATTAKVYRIDGTFDERGQGGMVQEKISDVGSECPQSAVQAEEGVFFLGTDGVYYTDGYKVMRINEDWTKTYQTFISSATKRNRIVGTYDDINRLIYWTIQANNSNSENDSFLILDLRWGIRPDATFLTHSNGDDFRPSSLAFYNGQLLRGDSRGYVFKHGTTYTSDPKVNTGANPSTWAKKAITWDFISIGADFGNAKVRKFIPSMNVTARNLGNLSLQCVSYNDDQDTGRSMKPIRYRSQYTGLIREGRMMPAGGLRCNFKQVQLTNAQVIITNSDEHGPASVNKGASTVTLDSFVTEDWPLDAIDWVLYFEKKNLGSGNVDDAYTTGYPVLVRTADTLTFTDAGGSAPSGSVKWVLKGTPKDEQFELQAINLAVQMIAGDEQGSFQKSDVGDNA